MVLAAGLVLLALLSWFVGVMIPNKGAQEFFVPAYAFLLLAVLRSVWVVVSRGRPPAELPIPDRKVQWVVGGSLAVVIWTTLFTVMTTSGPFGSWSLGLSAGSSAKRGPR